MTTRTGSFIASLFLAASAAACSSGAVAQTAHTHILMRDKLDHAQKLLEALTTSNYGQLQTETDEMVAIAQSPRWNELKTPELAAFTDVFLQSVADLSADARRRDLDMAAVHYNAMTMACMQCHRRLKDMRIAGGQEP